MINSKNKKIAAMLLALAVSASASFTAFAANGSGKTVAKNAKPAVKSVMAKTTTGSALDFRKPLACTTTNSAINMKRMPAKTTTGSAIDFKFDKGMKPEGPHGQMFMNPATLTDAQLADIAAKRGITVDALKAEFETKLAEIAKAKNITIDELKKQMTAEAETRLAAFAKEKGITTEAAKKLLAEAPKMGMKNEHFGGPEINAYIENNETLLKDMAARESITLDALKTKIETRLSEMAKAKNLTVDELKKQIAADEQTRLEAMAKEKGITVDELKKQMSEAKPFDGPMHRGHK